MLDTQPDSRSDRRDYLRPGCDVASADMIGVGRKAASGAGELRLRAAVCLVDVAALGTRSTRIARVHGDKRDTRKGGLVAEERAQLEERPRMQRRALGPANCYPVANAMEVFQGNATPGVFGLAHNRLADDVIGVGVEAPLPPSEFSEMTFGALGGSGLEPSAQPCDAAADGERFLARMSLSVRVDGEVADTEIDPEPAFRIMGHPSGTSTVTKRKSLPLR